MSAFVARLRSLSPFGPIFGKELRTTSRRRRNYVLRSLYLAALLLVLLFFYSVNAPRSYYYGSGGVAARAQHNAEMGQQFFAIFAYFTLVALSLIAPILTSTAISSERLHKTLHVLLMTPITAWQIVWGKLFSRMLIVLTLIGLSLPVLAVVRLMGGVEIWQMFAALALCISVAIMAAAVGLLLSALLNRAYVIILLAYCFLLFLWALIPMFIGLAVAAGGFYRFAALERTLTWLASLGHPFVAMFGIVDPTGVPALTRFVDWYWCAIIHLAFATILVLLSGAILRRRDRRQGATGGQPIAPPPPPATLPPSSAAVGPTSAPPLPLPSLSPVLRPRIWHNPVLWRELRRGIAARRWQAIAATVTILLILAGIYILIACQNAHRWGSALADPEVQIGFACVFCGLLNLLVCIIPATAIAQEKETDTWTLLLAAPLSAWQIIWGKLAGILRRLLWPSALIIVHFVVFALFGVITFPTLLLILWLTFTTNALWIATGLYLSLRLKTVTFAVILNLLGPVLIYGVVAAIAGILGAAIAHDEDWAEVVGLYAPYAYIAQGTEEMNQYEYSSSPRYSTPVRRRPVGEIYVALLGCQPWPYFAGLVILDGIAFLLVTGAIIAYATVRFDRIVGRAPQRQTEPFMPSRPLVCN